MALLTLVVVALCVGATSLHARQAPAAPPAPGDSARGDRSPLITRREAVLGLVGTAAGIGLMQFDPDVRRWLMEPSRQGEGAREFSDAIRHVNEKSLFAAELVLWGVGRLTDNEGLADASWHAAEAVLITSVSTTIVRVAVGRSRPFKSDGRDQFDFFPGRGWNDQAYRSVPSIHSAAAFATAAVVTSEVRRRRPELTKVVAPLSFGLATLPGLGRMHADKHWASDVALGVVWGTLAGIATVRWHHEHDDRLDRWMLGREKAPRWELGAAQAPNGDAMVSLRRPFPRP
jgi:membrane-associated phospholipid phosphatase